MLVIRVDIDKEIELGIEWMTRDDWELFCNDPDLFLERIAENSDEFIAKLGGWKEIIKWMRWID